MNLPDAQNHPAFAYRPETGEEPFASMLAVPVRRAGRTLGVLAVQNRKPRRYADDEVEELETVAMLLAEVLAAAGAADGAEEGVGATVPRVFAGATLVAGHRHRSGRAARQPSAPLRLLADDPEAELARLHDAVAAHAAGPRRADRRRARRLAAAPTGRHRARCWRPIAWWPPTPAGCRRVAEVIRGGLSAEAAVQRVAGELHDRMRRITDPYLRERLADLEDLAGRLLAALAGDAPRPPVPPGAILLARRLGPAELLDWHAARHRRRRDRGGQPAGHAAILARALGLPALGGTRGMLDAAEPGDEAVVDADEGQLVLRPEAEVRRPIVARWRREARWQAGWAALRDRPAITADGTPGQPDAECRPEPGTGAARRAPAPRASACSAPRSPCWRAAAIADVAEQAAIYARVLDAAAGRPVLFRTLDLGADKLLPGDAPEEENPAMGWRSLRVGLDRPALLRRQLRALLLAAGGRPLSVMFPMVATVAEFRAARALLLAEARRVRPAPERLSIGTMLEVPALMWQLDELLREVDFISVGSNDLLQFLFAADRGTPSLFNRYDLLSQPVLTCWSSCCRRRGRPRRGAACRCRYAARRRRGRWRRWRWWAWASPRLSMPASGILPMKALLAELDLAAFRPVLTAIRRNASGAASLREPIGAWAREHGLAV